MKSTITTEAWVLYQGLSNYRQTLTPGELKREAYSFPAPNEDEILAEPIYGCWEGNMTHAIQRQPVDVCRQRQEEKVVIGNGGVVRVLKIGRAVTNIHPGDLGLFFFAGQTDRRGYMTKIAGYDAPHSIGLLAKQIKLHPSQFLPLPERTRYLPRQWAAFCLRYLTAWSNWRVAYGTWKLQMTNEDMPCPSVWGWGGGVTLAELQLAQHFGCQTFMISSKDERIKMIEGLGITAVDRQQFPLLEFDERWYGKDPAYQKVYQEAENSFLRVVMNHTSNEGASIFMDNIGNPVFRATVKALSRQGVVTTVGWKKGMSLQVLRAIECINRHVHVFTHGARYSESLDAVQFAEKHGWLPPDSDDIYAWEDIPRLAEDFLQEKIISYFPLYQVNSL